MYMARRRRKLTKLQMTRTNTSAHDDGGAIFASGRARPAGESIQQCGVINEGKTLWWVVHNLLGPVSYCQWLDCSVEVVRLVVRGGRDVCHFERVGMRRVGMGFIIVRASCRWIRRTSMVVLKSMALNAFVVLFEWGCDSLFARRLPFESFE
jgi:hypothetical protein